MSLLKNGVVETGEITADSKAAVGFRHDYHSSAPICWLVNFTDDVKGFHTPELCRDLIAHRK